MGCVRCANNRTMFPEQVLAGEVITDLCCECMTEWSGFIRASDEWAEHVRLDAQRAYLNWRAVAGNAPTLDDVEAMYKAQGLARAAIRELALEFIKPLETT